MFEGKNEIIFNEASMIAAVQTYLDSAIIKGHGIKVVSVKAASPITEQKFVVITEKNL